MHIEYKTCGCKCICNFFIQSIVFTSISVTHLHEFQFAQFFFNAESRAEKITFLQIIIEMYQADLTVYFPFFYCCILIE